MKETELVKQISIIFHIAGSKHSFWYLLSYEFDADKIDTIFRSLIFPTKEMKRGVEFVLEEIMNRPNQECLTKTL